MGFKKRPKATHTVIGQNWEESEAGWGTRPDGFTLHLTLEDHKQYVDSYWKRQKAFYDERIGEGITPSEYTRTSGNPKPIIVNDETYQAMVKFKDKLGMWGLGRSMPSAVQTIDGTTISVNIPSNG
jgi:hypothetical protein